MDYRITINLNGATTKKEQIINSIIRDIERGSLKIDERLPSINEFSKSHQVARDTVEKAYQVLRQKGYLKSVAGMGNYVLTNTDGLKNILMLINKMSAYKKEVYEAFIDKLNGYAKVELKIYHYDPTLFREIVMEHAQRFHYIVVMPHFYAGTSVELITTLISGIECKQLVILDKEVPIVGKYIAVYQDFNNDIYDAFLQHSSLFDKYKSIKVIFPKSSHHPTEIIEGVKAFAKSQGLISDVVSDVICLSKGDVFVTLTESDLGNLIKKVRAAGYLIGVDIGIVSFNETVLKELLDITVVTTDFKAMGEKAAEMIISNRIEKCRNNFIFYKRGSL